MNHVGFHRYTTGGRLIRPRYTGYFTVYEVFSGVYGVLTLRLQTPLDSSRCRRIGSLGDIRLGCDSRVFEILERTSFKNTRINRLKSTTEGV